MIDKKAFFERRTPAEIKEGKEPVLLEKRIVAALQRLQPNQYAVISEKAFDARFGDPAKFMKHGETLALRASSIFGKTPGALFKEAITHPQELLNPYQCGYSFKPLTGPDRVPRRVPFVELLEAARILAYGKEFPGADVKVEGEYTGAARVRTEGGSFVVSTPSRSRKHDRYRFIISSIPMHYAEPFVYLIPYSFASKELGAESKAFRELRFASADSAESSPMYYAQAHEIAAAYAVAEVKLEKKNPIPHRFLVFPTVSQQAVDLYMKLMNKTLLQVQEGEITRQKHLTQAHMEAIMWNLVQRQGYSAGFDDTALPEGRARTYQWNNHVQA